jgi:hypothetical protein
MGIVFQDGLLLFRSGQIALSDNCCCDGIPDISFATCAEFNAFLTSNSLCSLKASWSYNVNFTCTGGGPAITRSGVMETCHAPSCWAHQANPLSPPATQLWNPSFQIFCQTFGGTCPDGPAVIRRFDMFASITSGSTSCGGAGNMQAFECLYLPVTLAQMLAPFTNRPASIDSAFTGTACNGCCVSVT